MKTTPHVTADPAKRVSQRAAPVGLDRVRRYRFKVAASPGKDIRDRDVQQLHVRIMTRSCDRGLVSLPIDPDEQALERPIYLAFEKAVTRRSGNPAEPALVISRTI